MISIENYLRALGLACIEAAGEPRVRPLLLALLLIAPKTIAELRRSRAAVATGGVGALKNVPFRAGDAEVMTSPAPHQHEVNAGRYCTVQ